LISVRGHETILTFASSLQHGVAGVIDALKHLKEAGRVALAGLLLGWELVQEGVAELGELSLCQLLEGKELKLDGVGVAAGLPQILLVVLVALLSLSMYFHLFRYYWDQALVFALSGGARTAADSFDGLAL